MNNKFIKPFTECGEYFLTSQVKYRMTIETTSADSLVVIARSRFYNVYLETFIAEVEELVTVLNIWQKGKQLLTQSGTLQDMLSILNTFENEQA